ncbi:MAG TPA: hypothetical protein VJA25_13640, partial [Dehalococcoidia bacterium]|nr:hypothetical protein [Dehalococcoidia bacterium]
MGRLPRSVVFALLVFFFALSEVAVRANVQSWSSYNQVSGVGDAGDGADLAFTNLDADPRPEMILMAYDNPAG